MYTRLEKLHIFLDLFEGLDYDKKAKLLAIYKDPLDILVNFSKDEKIKDILGGIVIVKHAGETYLKLTNPELFRHLLKEEKS